MFQQQHVKYQQIHYQRSLFLTNDQQMHSQLTASLDTQVVLDVEGMNSHRDSKVPVQFQLPQIHNQSQQIHSREHQEEFRQRVRGQDEAQRPHSFSNGSFTSVSRLNITANAATLGQRNAIRWLLFLIHASRCLSPQGKCLEVNCIKVQQLLKHIKGCSIAECSYSRCRSSKNLILHHKKCTRQTCSICVPVRSYIQSQNISKYFCTESRIKPPARHPLDSDFVNPVYESCKSADPEGDARLEVGDGKQTSEASEALQSIVKRVKLEHPSSSLILNNENSLPSVPATSQLRASQDAHSQLGQQFDVPRKVEHENIDVKKGSLVSSWRDSPLFDEREPMYRKGTDALVKQESMKVEKDVDAIKQETYQEMAAVCTAQSGITKSEKPKIKGVSLTELFTPEEIRRHIIGLRQWVGQSKAKAEKNQAMEHSMSENSCQLCAVEKLSFEPPPIYCTPCGVRIKRNALYYTIGSGETRQYFCVPCYNEHRGDTIVIDGNTVLKTTMEKKKNDEETEEWVISMTILLLRTCFLFIFDDTSFSCSLFHLQWVQCDKCEAWQHQICALFNGRRNDGGQAEYTCPNCYIGEIERGERNPLPQSAVLGAKDLPKTILSDHIEDRLFRRLRQEKEDRARVQGKNVDEVPGAVALVVRVVSSVDKKLDVKPRFLEIFQEDNYPTEFPYKSKVILLFQKIEGVEVCLFGMYVQEFGSESLLPNQRRVYLSYLDSVKYFRPDIKAVTGEALRTFVYHEILIAYLEYCKKRGFTSCYIWACPPLKGEDYILYCHPEIQKTPKSDKLREWYLSMLRKASEENIVVELTNLYDYFFVSTGECKAKVTAARLPYFDGDYWPGAAEDMINQLCQEEDGSKQQKKGKTKKIITKRVLKAAGQTDLSTNASKDILLMQKVEVNDVPEDTKDMDDILESEFFDTRQAFLSLCQGNHYQYDTLRRAKHSSMMVLYHLHNPTAPAFVATCNICHNEIETGQGWRCESCTDYDLCNTCYNKDERVGHPHKLTKHLSVADRDAQNKEARQLRVLQVPIPVVNTRII
ncbi:histone acetyltransferase [Ranunculus cassubicifolius]